MRTLIIAAFTLALTGGVVAQAERPFTESLMQDTCEFSTTGRNTYLILEPGYQLTLENKTGYRLVISVLNETRKVGKIETRVVEENESKNGKTLEVSRNFFALCRQNGSVYYFGEEVDIYKDGKVVAHEGAWEATGNNKAGVAMPGLPLLGARYYQEIAPGIAMDRAEIVSLWDELTTPAGKFVNCLKTEETTPIEPKEKEFKIYAPGVGLIKDEDSVLVKYGFIKK
jgi:hypothetical protein